MESEAIGEASRVVWCLLRAGSGGWRDKKLQAARRGSSRSAAGEVGQDSSADWREERKEADTPQGANAGYLPGSPELASLLSP